MEDKMQKIIELYRQENYSDCLFLVNDLIKNNTTNFDALAYKASSMSHLGMFKEAIDTFSKCLDLDDTKFHIWVLRGDVFYEIKDYEKAFSDYWISLQLEPDNGAVLDKMARSLFNLGDEDRALEYIEKAIKISESPEPILVMMAMLNKMGMYGFLHKLFDFGVSKFPERRDDFNRYKSLGLFKS